MSMLCKKELQYKFLGLVFLLTLHQAAQGGPLLPQIQWGIQDQQLSDIHCPPQEDLPENGEPQV